MPGAVAPLAERTIPHTPDALVAALTGLHYPGFTCVRRRAFVNPAVVLWGALTATASSKTRLVEALPWVAWKYSELDWDWLAQRLKLEDLQNRLGFVVALAKHVASGHGDNVAAAGLASVEARLKRARLVGEDTLCREPVTEAEQRWMASARSAVAPHWNVLSGLRPASLPYAA